MKITWIGHSCFKLEKDGYSLLIDPYSTGSVPGYLPVNMEANEVLCSHEHRDHHGIAEVRILPSETASPFHIQKLESFHDEAMGAKRGRNEILIVSDGTDKLAHLGDLGCELTESQLFKLQNLSCLLIPVGGCYTIDGKQAAELVRKLKPHMVIPMHYRDEEAGFGYEEISTIEDFLKEAGDAMSVSESEVDTETELPDTVLLLKPLRAEKFYRNL